MDERGYRDDLKKIVLEMTQKDLEGNASQRGIKKYLEGNIDKIINENIKKASSGMSCNNVYLNILKNGSNEKNISLIVKSIKSEDLFKSKKELIKFARYLGINATTKNSHNSILRRIASHIYSNRSEYSKRYFSYQRGDREYILEPERIKEDLIESYKSKARNDMKSIAKLLEISVDDEDNAEDIRRKVINYIMKEKLNKK